MPSDVEGRILIAPDDGPLVQSPSWQRIDAPGGDFPDQLVSGYDIKSGRQTLLSQTDGGTGTVYINDHYHALFDPRNPSSPFYQALDGKQILFQLYDPVRDLWEQQFRGVIDLAGFVIGPDTTPRGIPINAAVTLNCVDRFDYLAGFGLTPGLAGDRPPKGGDNGVWYAPTAGEIHDRIIQIFADTGILPSVVPSDGGYIVFSGNVAGQLVKYDPDEPALNALRDCADAEFPFIANLYVDRFGRPVFHGRYGRLDPFGLSADVDSDRWDFQYFLLGDGVAVRDDSNRTQMRVLEFDEGRANIVNVAVAYPQGIPQDKMINQIYADTASIDAYGHYAAPPMSDLLTAKPINDNLNGHPDWDRYSETFHFAKLLVENQKDPRPAITALQIKTVHPLDHRAPNVWSALTRSDVSDMCNVRAGYGPGGTGFAGDSPDDDYFIEGRQMRVRPLSSSAFDSALPGYDYVELDLDVTPAVWSMDTHGVFPARA